MHDKAPHLTRLFVALLLFAGLLSLAPASAGPVPAQEPPGALAPLEHDIDGAWTGTFQLGGDEFPLQLNLNIEDESGTAVVFLHDGEPATLGLLNATIDRAKPRRIVLGLQRLDKVDDGGDDGDDDGEDDGEDDDDGDDDDDEEDDPDVDDDPYGPERAGDDTMGEQYTLRLRYITAQDILRGRISGDLRGRVVLERMDPDLPVRRLWVTTLGNGDDAQHLLLQLFEPTPEEGDSGPAEIEGAAWLGDQEGSVAGERTGKSVDLMIELPGESIEASLRLRRRDNQLRGRLTSNTRNVQTRFLPIGGNSGKPMKLRAARPRLLEPDGVSLVTVRGKNFGAGATIHADHDDVHIISVDRTSPRRLQALVGVGADAADTTVDLQAVNGDGQLSTKKNALRIGLDTGDDGGDGSGVSFASDVEPIFATTCALAGCHSAATAQEGLVLAAGSAYANLVNVPSSQRPELDRIAPGLPDDSYLIMKIRGDAGIQGGRMPLNRPALSQAQIDTIVTWVEQQAPNNRPDGGS